MLAKRFALCLLLGLPVAGCAIKRASYDVPSLTLPEQFKNHQSFSAKVGSEMAGGSTAATLPAGQGLESTDWWRSLGSEELTRLIDRGIANNPDIKIASLRVAQAKIRADQVRALKWPTLGSSVTIGSQRGNGPANDFSGAGLNGAWRADIWGEQAALGDEADYQLWQAIFDAENVRRNTVASIATSYVDYLLANDRLKVVRETEKVLGNMLATMEKRAALGDATLIDLEQQRATISAERSAVSGLEQQREDAINNIAFLVGSTSGSVSLSDADLASVQVPSALPRLPSSLLVQRPDVRSVEARLLAADVDIDVMRARFLPSIDLSTQIGVSGALSSLLQSGVFFSSIFANVSMSLFDAGKRAGDSEHARVFHEEMIETYFRTILQAMKEVESSLSSVRLVGKRQALQEEASIAARRAWDISQKMYLVGGVDFMALQDTERTYHRYLGEWQNSRAGGLRSYINLFQAVGDMPSVTSAEKSPDKRAGMMVISTGSESALTRLQSWQVLLPGVYFKSALDAVSRDLQARYSKQMEGRVLLIHREAQLQHKSYGQAAWYRLAVTQFNTESDAQAFCKILQSNQQRCQVVSSRSSDALH